MIKYIVTFHLFTKDFIIQLTSIRSSFSGSQIFRNPSLNDVCQVSKVKRKLKNKIRE